MEKITKREVFVAIMKMAQDGNMHIEDFAEGLTDAAVVEFCANEIEHLDKKAAKAKETAANKKAEGDALTNAVRTVMSTTDFESIATIAARVEIEGEEVTASKVQYRLTQLVKNGEAEKQDVEIVDGDNKKRKVKGYRLI
jgi:hypothetical protein